jgi:hypothetical protein
VRKAVSLKRCKRETRLCLLRRQTQRSVARSYNVSQATIFAVSSMTDRPDPTPERLRRVFDEGRTARNRDLDLNDNPHPARTVERRKWYEGWCHANLIRHIAKFGL